MSWGQLATAFACRSETRWVARLAWRGNPPLLAAVATEIMILFMFIGVRPAADLLGGGFPPATGWLTAAAVIPAVIAADAAHKALHTRPPGPEDSHHQSGARRVAHLAR